MPWWGWGLVGLAIFAYLIPTTVVFLFAYSQRRPFWRALGDGLTWWVR